MIPLAAIAPDSPRGHSSLLERLGALSYLPHDPDLRHNARRSLLDGMAWSVMAGLFNPFLGVFALALGASDYMVGLLTSLPALTGMLGQALGAILADRSERRLPVVVVWAFLGRVFFVLYAALPFLPVGSPITRAWIFVLAVGLMNLPVSVAALAWTSLMQKLFPAEYRGQLFGERNAFLGAVTLTATAVGGWLLSVIRFPYNFTALNLAAFAFLMVSLYHLTRLREAAARRGGVGRTMAGGRAVLRRMAANRPFLRFLGAIAAFWFGLFLPQALYPILFVRVMHMPTTWIGLLYTAGGLAAVLTYRFWGRFADRHGHRFTLALTATVRPIHSLCYCFVHAFWAPAAVELAFCTFVSGYDLSVFNSILEVAPAEDSPAYIAVFNIVNGLIVLSAPLLGVWLASQTSVRAGIGIGSAARLVGVALLWAMARGAGSAAGAGARRAPAAGAAAPKEAVPA